MRKTKCCNADRARLQDWYYCTNCLRIIKGVMYHYPLIIGTILLLIILLSSFTAKAPNNAFKKQNAHKEYLILNDDSLLKYMYKIGILFPEIVLKQIHWESAHFKSNITFENKNILGIKYIKQPLAIGENRNHAVFKSYEDCLLDYKRLQKYYLGNLRRYAEDSTYTKKLQI